MTSTPLLRLNEFLTKNQKQKPEFLLQSSGPPHTPIFNISCKLANGSILTPPESAANFKSKKDAEQAMALILLDTVQNNLDLLENKNLVVMSGGKKISADGAERKKISADDKKGYRNYKGELQEFCQKNKIPMPVYECSSIPNVIPTIFECRVRVLDLDIIATGKLIYSKKDAEQVAAQLALTKLQSQGVTSESLPVSQEIAQLEDMAKSNNIDMKFNTDTKSGLYTVTLHLGCKTFVSQSSPQEQFAKTDCVRQALDWLDFQNKLHSTNEYFIDESDSTPFFT